MNNFEKNIISISKIQHELAEKLKENYEDLKKQYEIYYNFNNEPVLRKLDSKNNYIHYTSYYNPVEQAKEMVSVLEHNKNRRFIICFGVGLGYHIDELLKVIGEKDMILVVESNTQLLKDVLEYKDYSNEIDENRLFFAVGEYDDDFLKQTISKIVRLFSFNIVYIQFVKFNLFDIEYLKSINNILEYVIKTRDAYYYAIGNDLDDTLIGIKNNYDNVSRYIRNPGLMDFKRKYGDIYKDKPAIIIASGPSLNNNIHHLAKAKGKALLLACDGSMTSLKKHGITPDTVGSVERIYETYDKFYKDKKFDNNVVLTAPAIVRKEIVDTFDNKILSFFKSESIGAWFNKGVLNKGTVWCGACVAHVMFGLAHELGCNPIILVGQDLAYSEDGVSHVAEAEVKETVELSKAEVYVKGKNGKMIPSSFDWQQFLTIYHEAVRTTSRKIIDATEGGALIEGTELSTLEEVIEKYCTEDILNFREGIDSIEIDEEYIEKATKNLIELSKKQIEIMEKINKKATKALKDNRIAYKYIQKNVIDKKMEDFIYNSIEYVEKHLVKGVFKDDTTRMYFQYLIYRAAQKISSINDKTFTKENLKLNLEIHEELIKDIIKFSKKAIDVYKDGIRTVQSN